MVSCVQSPVFPASCVPRPGILIDLEFSISPWVSHMHLGFLLQVCSHHHLGFLRRTPQGSTPGFFFFYTPLARCFHFFLGKVIDIGEKAILILGVMVLAVIDIELCRRDPLK